MIIKETGPTAERVKPLLFTDVLSRGLADLRRIDHYFLIWPVIRFIIVPVNSL